MTNQPDRKGLTHPLGLHLIQVRILPRSLIHPLGLHLIQVGIKAKISYSLIIPRFRIPQPRPLNLKRETLLTHSMMGVSLSRTPLIKQVLHPLA